jgi:hypothetical protein
MRFSADIYKLGINPVVDPPGDVLDAVFEQAGRSTGAIPVCGRLNGAAYLQTLVKYVGAWRLYINGEMLKASGLQVGDTADIEIDFDPRPRTVPMPPMLQNALSKNKAAGAAFERLTPSRQKEILRYLGSLKTDESLRRNVEKVIVQLAGTGNEPPPVFMARKK